MTESRTDTRTLGYAMLLLSRKLQDAIDSANAHEAAERMIDQLREIALLKQEIEQLKAQGGDIAHAQVVPDGWKLVPVEPTGPMLLMGIHAIEKIQDISADMGLGPAAKLIYQSMIAAALKMEKMK